MPPRRHLDVRLRLHPRLAAAISAVIALASPAAADAHLRSGVVAVDYRTSVTSPQAATPHVVRAQVSPSDRALALTVARGHTVDVLDSSGATSKRIDARQARSDRTLVWHDARLRGLPDGVQRGRWVVPIVVDGARSQVGGSISRVPAPPIWPWLLAGIAFALAAARRRRLASACTVCAVTAGLATLAIAAEFGASGSASGGLLLESGDELVFAAVGLIALTRGSDDGQLIAAAALGFLAIVVGGLKAAAFTHGVVLSALPASVTRGSIALALWSGLAAAALAIVLLSRAAPRSVAN